MTSPTPKRAYKSLQYFLNRSSVLAQYRQFLRTTVPLEAAVRRDVRQQIRAGFESYRALEDDNHVGRLLRQSKEQLKMVSDLVDTATAKQRLAAATSAASLSPSSPTTTRAAGSMVQSSTKDTWMEPQEDNPEDVKGRVGTGWPWKSDKPVKKLELAGVRRRYGPTNSPDEQ